MLKQLCVCILVVIGVASCQTVENVMTSEPKVLSQSELTALMLDKPYLSSIASIKQTGFPKEAKSNGAMVVPNASGSVFGPLISRYFLTEDFVVYRHGKQANPVPLSAVTANDTSLGPVDSAQPVTLTYFLVDPQGIVVDYATGSVTPDASGCITFSGDSVITCDNATELSAALRRFDQSVITREGATVASWSGNTPASQPLPEAQPVQ